MNIQELAHVSHAAAKSKGFWDGERNKPELLMLIVSEAAEALEALRKNRFSKKEEVEELFEKLFSEQEVSLVEFKTEFESKIKNTFEDEIADTIIRLFDLAGGLNIDIQKHILLKLEYNMTRGHKHGKQF